jgi:hypothetical protein
MPEARVGATGRDNRDSRYHPATRISPTSDAPPTTDQDDWNRGGTLDAAGLPRYGGCQERFENKRETDDDCERQRPGDFARERDRGSSSHAGPAWHSA